jgi:hypothetical protein
VIRDETTNLDQPRQDHGLDDGTQSTTVEGKDAVVSIAHIDVLLHGVVAHCPFTCRVI